MIKENLCLGKYEQHPVGLKLKKIVVGREQEIETIKMQFDAVLEGNTALAVIAGDIGCGKTTLIKTVLADLSKPEGTCVYGKFEQFKNEEPYIAIIQIIEQITDQILTLPGQKLERIKSKLVKELRKDSTLITGIIPKTQKIIGGSNSSAKTSDYKKLKVRLEKAFQAFIAVAAKDLYPLIIAIDDIQWADKPSWDIIKSIADPSCGYDIYIILSYRNNLEEYTAKVNSMLDRLDQNKNVLEINLESLTIQAVKMLLTGIFGRNLKNADKLQRLIYRKTAGNPLYINQTLSLLLKREGIYYNPQAKAWCVNPAIAREVNLPDSIVGLINSKTGILSDDLKNLLEIASCIGSKFSIGLLARITNEKLGLLEQKLKDLCRTGLILEAFERQGTCDNKGFEFFHDRIYQNVYEHIAPERKEWLHFNIAMELLNHPSKTYIEENILPIASHLLNCKSIIKREGAEEKLIEYLYLAGVKAKRSAAVEHALRLLSLGEELLGDSCWQKDYDNSFKIKLELAECEFICGKYDAAMEHFEEMLGHANGREALVEIKKRYMVMYSYAGNHDRVIDLGVQALKHLGINIDMHRLKIQIIREILYGRVLFRSGRLELIKNAPTITDKRLANALEILSIMAASANLLDGKLFILIVLKIGNLSAKHGNSPYSPLGYAAYGLVLGSVMGNYKKAERLKDISVSLAELFDDDLFAAPTYFCIGTFIAHWTSPAKESLDYLQKAFECGMRSGDYLYCGYTMILMTEMKYLIGTPFDELGKVLELNRKYAQRMNNDILLRSVAMFNDHMNMLSSPVFSGKERLVDDKEIEMLGTNEYMIYTLLKVQRLYLNGKLEEAYRLVRRAMKCLDTVMGSITQVDYVF